LNLNQSPIKVLKKKPLGKINTLEEDRAELDGKISAGLRMDMDRVNHI
jgi:hypothetical protein